MQSLSYGANCKLLWTSVMELTLPQSVVAAAAFLLCLLLWAHKNNGGSHRRVPPSPRALPIIGHLHLLGELPHQSLSELARVYGPLMNLRLGSTQVVVASSPEMAKQLLTTHDEAFASRPRLASTVYTMFNCSDVGSAPHGAYHRFVRQQCVQNMLQEKRVREFVEERAQEISRLARAVHAESMSGQQQPMKVRTHIMAATNNVVSRMALGHALSDLSSFDPHFISYLKETLHLLGVFNLGDYIPCLAWLDLQGYEKRMKAVQQRIRACFQKVIQARRALQRGDNVKDLLDALLIAQSNPLPNLSLTDDNIIAILLDIFVAGMDTTSLTVEWALGELLNNPTVMGKAYDELDAVVGRECLVQESDIPKLPYLQAIIYETLRLHPPAPLLVPHESQRACEIEGYLLPSKTRAYINVWAIGRDPNFYERPLDFWPERFINMKVNIRSENFEFVPFGFGRRSCPGWHLGQLMSQLNLATLLQCFQWKLPPSSEKTVNMSEKFGLTVEMAQPLFAIPTSRVCQDRFFTS